MEDECSLHWSKQGVLERCIFAAPHWPTSRWHARWSISQLHGCLLRLWMAQEDEDKTTFYIGDAVYYYRMMQSELKNASAIYQCLVNRLFLAQIGKTTDAYVDEITVKSTNWAVNIEDHHAAFEIMRKKNFLLNPEKFAFGVSSRKFLGFMLSHRGIEISLEK